MDFLGFLLVPKTVNPLPERCSAIAFPIPEDAPVMRIVFECIKKKLSGQFLVEFVFVFQQAE